MSAVAQRVARSWSWPGVPQIDALPGGLINASFVVAVGGRPVAALQRLNTAVFAPVVHQDIEAVTAHLERRGVPTPRLLRTRPGGLYHDAGPEGAWRALSWVGDRTVVKVSDTREARSAAALLGRVHGALRDLAWDFRSVRPGPHDTVTHMQRMVAAVEEHPGHRLAAEVGPLVEEVAERWASWEGERDHPERIVHGDPKIANVRFAGPDALALVDLDTFQRGALAVELGDAMRSWCNPASEDSAGAVFDLGVFEAAMTGYREGAEAAGQPPLEEEWRAVVPSIERIALELASRFLRDALEERYFGFDPRHGGRGEHNLLRARGQLDLARRVREARGEAARALARARR